MKPRVRLGCSASIPATAAGKVSMTRFGDAVEEGPGRLQASDHLVQLLAVGGPHETVPGVGQHHQQGPYRAPAAGLLIVDEAQTPEVQLAQFPRAVLSHANRRRLASLPVATPEPPVQGRIGYPTPPCRQQLLDAGDLQLILGDPPVDLIRPRGQQFLSGFRRDTGTRSARRRQHVELVLGGRCSLLGPPQTPWQPPDTSAQFPGTAPCLRLSSAGYPPPASAGSLPAEPFPVCHVRSGHLVRHRRSSRPGAATLGAR